jgi:hypothetical protein
VLAAFLQPFTQRTAATGLKLGVKFKPCARAC